MKIAILSDIHDNIWTLQAALGVVQEVDLMICCGDLCAPFIVDLIALAMPSKPVHIVFGNNDGDPRRNTDKTRTHPNVHVHGEFFQSDPASEFDGKRFAVNHYDAIALPIARSGEFDVVCFGHNHRYQVEQFGRTLAINPGTIIFSRRARHRSTTPDRARACKIPADLGRAVCIDWQCEFRGRGQRRILQPISTVAAEWQQERRTLLEHLVPGCRHFLDAGFVEHQMLRGGGKRTLADNFEGKRFNSPNDLTVERTGNIYFTDPPYGLPQGPADTETREIAWHGIYRISPAGKVTLLSQEMTFPNGIALSPDEQTLYVGMESSGGKVLKIQKISLKDGDWIYLGKVDFGTTQKNLFSKLASRRAVCDIWHDTFFLYTFDSEGKVIDIVPIQLTKVGNLNWTEEDMKKIKTRTIGRSILSPFTFDASVDSVSGATITAVLIFDSLDKAKEIFEKLKKEAYVK